MSADVDRTEAATQAPVPAEAAPKRKRGGGPRTAEGRDQSKRNSLKHGLLAESVLPVELAAAIARRTAMLFDEFKPTTLYEEMLVIEMARSVAKIDRINDMICVDLQRTMDRARTCWDRDRSAYIESLGARLHRDPRRVAKALGGSKQGNEFLVENWEQLGDILSTNGEWSEPQRSLAYDLLGVPVRLRDGCTLIPDESDANGLAALVEREISRLLEDREAVLIEVDEAERKMVASGMSTEEDAATSRLRRYEASERRSFSRALDELLRVREGASPSREMPAPKERPTPADKGPVRDFLEERAKLLIEDMPEEYAEGPIPVEPPPPARTKPPAEPRPPVAATPVSVEASAPCPPPVVVPRSPSPEPPVKAGNRRQRRAEELRARKAAHRRA